MKALDGKKIKCTIVAASQIPLTCTFFKHPLVIRRRESMFVNILTQLCEVCVTENASTQASRPQGMEIILE